MTKQMTKQELATALEKAIAAHESDDAPGTWSAYDGDGYVQLIWTCNESDVPEEMYGDEPWSQWGGDKIMEAAGVPQQDDSGVDSYTDKYGDAVVAQWVQWDMSDGAA